MKKRFILHSDLNNFYASVEMLKNRKWENYALLITGNADLRHGIVLARNTLARSYGVTTGDTLHQAKIKCKGLPLKLIQADMNKYAHYSVIVKNIYKEYSDNVESFGIDEAWIDISKTVFNWQDATTMANRLRQEVYDRTGLTVSVGVSYNKVFAKLGSNLKKPNATTTITDSNFKSIAWPLPMGELLYVGKKTREKLSKYAFKTIGDIANSDVCFLKSLLGKRGEMLWNYANGKDDSPVNFANDLHKFKSVGNSTTCPKDLTQLNEVKTIFYVLAESVAERLKRLGYWASELQISIRNNELHTIERQCKLDPSTNLSSEFANTALRLFEKNYSFKKPIRSLGLQAKGLTDSPDAQLNIFSINDNYIKNSKIDKVMESIRKQHGNDKIVRGVVAKNQFIADGFTPDKPCALNMETDDEFAFHI